MKPEHLRCDAAGEHQTKLKEVAVKHGVELEKIARNTPQHNGRTEKRLADNGRSTYAALECMPYSQELKEKTRRAEAKAHAVKTRNMLVMKKGEEPAIVQHTRRPVGLTP